MGPEVLEHECGFSFAALPGGAVRAVGCPEWGALWRVVHFALLQGGSGRLWLCACRRLRLLRAGCGPYALTAGGAACYHRKKGRPVRVQKGAAGCERKRKYACSGTFLPLCGV